MDWVGVERIIEGMDSETVAWSRQRLGDDAYHFANSFSITKRGLDVLSQALSESPPQEAGILKYRGVQIQLEFAFRRLINAWRLVLEGYHFDARTLQRLAWEATNRAAYYLINEDAGVRFLGGEEVRESVVRSFLKKWHRENLPEEAARIGDPLRDQWNSLSLFSHAYKFGALSVQSIVEGDTLSLRQTGVRKPDELYVSLGISVFLMQRVARLIWKELSELNSWPPELTADIERAAKDREVLERKIQQLVAEARGPSGKS